MSKSEEIVRCLNKFRFKNQSILQKLIKVISQDISLEQKTITLKKLNRTIEFYDEAIIQRLINYLHENDVVN